MGLIFFILITVTILLGSHYLVYATTVQFFDITNTDTRATLRIVVLLLAVSFIAWLSHLTPFACCKRALAAALFGYIVGTLTAKALNAILISAMVEYRIREQEEQTGAD